MLPPRRGQQVLALIAAVILLTAFVFALSFAGLQVGRLGVSLPVMAAVICLNCLLTAARLLAFCRSILAVLGRRMWARPGVPSGTVLQFALPAGDPGLSNA
jgi:hypothetical protein